MRAVGNESEECRIAHPGAPGQVLFRVGKAPRFLVARTWRLSNADREHTGSEGVVPVLALFSAAGGFRPTVLRDSEHEVVECGNNAQYDDP